jgi:hypothetical protein
MATDQDLATMEATMNPEQIRDAQQGRFAEVAKWPAG